MRACFANIFHKLLLSLARNALYVIARHKSGTPRDTVYPWGKGAHKHKSERYRLR